MNESLNISPVCNAVQKCNLPMLILLFGMQCKFKKYLYYAYLQRKKTGKSILQITRVIPFIFTEKTGQL